MLLSELFENDLDGGVSDDLRQALLDMLTPLAVRKVRFVKVDQVIDELRRMKTGIVIDRATAMNMLDPDTLPMIARVEGDKIYLTTSPAKTNMSSKTDEEKDKAKVADKAVKNAKAAVGS